MEALGEVGGEEEWTRAEQHGRMQSGHVASASELSDCLRPLIPQSHGTAAQDLQQTSQAADTHLWRGSGTSTTAVRPKRSAAAETPGAQGVRFEQAGGMLSGWLSCVRVLQS
jgi:hypothetical protein